jgi:hypothetical protein
MPHAPLLLLSGHRNLIEWLAETYPERCPRKEDDEREIWMYAGERRLINTLLQRLKKETERRQTNRETL